MDEQRWLVLIYKVPSEPSRLRAGVWRRLKALGAVYLQNSVAAFPRSPTTERAMRKLRNDIGEMGGEAHVLDAAVIAGHSDVVTTFNAARDEEYEEIADRARDFLDEIARETAKSHFTYAELEENDEDLVKLRNWRDKVRARDVLGAAGGGAVDEALSACEKALQEFAERVYQADKTH